MGIKVALQQVFVADLALDRRNVLLPELAVELANHPLGHLVGASAHDLADFVLAQQLIVVYESSFTSTIFTTI